MEKKVTVAGLYLLISDLWFFLFRLSPSFSLALAHMSFFIVFFALSHPRG